MQFAGMYGKQESGNACGSFRLFLLSFFLSDYRSCLIGSGVVGFFLFFKVAASGG
jgi:hypothetical protein